MASKIGALWNHPAGPKTSLHVNEMSEVGENNSKKSKRLASTCKFNQVHFWAPTCKWGISVANVADFSKPPEVISYPQQLAVTATGVIWSRYSMVIIPKNWNLFSVNIAMVLTGTYQLSRKIQQDFMGVPDAPLKK